MALVSAGEMGEAVLGYGDDGIASEVVNTARDGGVFVSRLAGGEGLAEEIRLVAGLQQQQHEDEEGRKGRVRVLMGEPDAGEGDANRREVSVQHHLLNVGLDSDLISKAARLANGTAEPRGGREIPDHLVENGDHTLSVEEEGSHSSDPGSPDHLVEMAIQSLDDKVEEA